MKMMKLALLGGAALAVTAAGARADDLSAMKAEIEALNARVAQLETAPAVPAGYQLMTLGSGDATVVPGNAGSDKFGTQVARVSKISVMPTADAPAAASVEWSGYVHAVVYYTHDKWSGHTADGASFSSTDHTAAVWSRGQIKVIAKTDTSVGEVGVRVNVRGDLWGVRAGSGFHTNAYMHETWGWWAMTPELTLGGGYSGSLGNVGYGYDGACTCYNTDSAHVDFNPNDTEQMRLTYASGPFSIAAAIENSAGDGSQWSELDGTSNTNLGVAGAIKYTGDTVNGSVNAFWHNNDGTDPYGIGAGVGFSLGDMASLSVGAQFARTRDNVDRYGVSALASMNLSDAVHAEVAGGYRHYNKGGGENWAALAGVYYAPVKQLTIGLEGEYRKAGAYSAYYMGAAPGVTKVQSYTVDLVTVFAF